MKYHIPVIAEIEASSIEEARRAAYKALETIKLEEFKGGDEAETTPITLAVANDECRAKTGQRIFILHPSDTDSDYNPDDYAAAHNTEE